MLIDKHCSTRYFLKNIFHNFTNQFLRFHESIFLRSIFTPIVSNAGSCGRYDIHFFKNGQISRSTRSIPWRSPLLPLKRSLATRTRSIPWRSPLLPLKRSLATRTRSIPWRSPLLPLRWSFATNLSAILPADLAFYLVYFYAAFLFMIVRLKVAATTTCAADSRR